MKLNRRSALLGGSTAVALAGLGLTQRKARAQNAAGPVRFLAVRTPHGVDRDLWIPRQGSGAAPASADEALSGLTFDYENAFLEPLMNWRDKITVLDGIDSKVTREGTRGNVRDRHGHNEQGSMLTGSQPPAARDANYDGHPSLDFHLHQLLGAPVLLTAALGGVGSNTWKCMSYDNSGSARIPETNPEDLFRLAFPVDFMPPDPGEPQVDYAPGENLILAQARGGLTELEERLASVERDKLRSHREALRGVPEDGVGMLAACETSGSDVPTLDDNLSDVDEVRMRGRAHAAVIAQAFACGRSMCATLQLLHDGQNVYTDIPGVRSSGVEGIVGGDYRFHDDCVHSYWSEDDAGRLSTFRRAYAAGQRWAAENFAAVLDELDSVVDPLDPNGGSILDNTIVFWHNEFGHEGHDQQHTRQPCIIAGGGGRTLRLGRYLRFRNVSENENVNDVDLGDMVPHNKLLVSIAHAVGRTEIDFFGDRDLESRADYRGPLEQLMA